ncbi:MAG: AEC family transporter [Acidobacteriota bacterium]
MLSILAITFPFFALIAAGYVCVVLTWIPVDAVRALNAFVLYVALPCMLFKFSAGLDMGTLLSQPFLPIYGLVGIGLFTLLLLFGRMRGIAWRNLSFAALVGVFPNTGFIGVPLAVSMLGSRAATPAIAIVLFDMIVTSSLSVATSTLDGHGWSSAGKASVAAIRGVFSNPMLWAMLAGIAMAVMHVRPGPVWHQPIWMMADAATPVALFTIGGILARSRIDNTTPRPQHASSAFVVAKLGLHPFMMWAAVWTAVKMGWQIERWVAQTLILMAALPSASNVSFLADRMGGDAAWVARVILWTTVGAFATLTMWAWWLGPAA